MNFEELTAGLDRWPDDAPSRLDIDRLHAGEIDDEAADALMKRIEASPEASAYLEQRRRGFDDDPLDPRVSLAAIRRGVADARAARQRPNFLRWLVPIAAALAAAAASFFFLAPDGETGPTDTVRLKGEMRLRVFRRATAGAEEVLSGDPFAPGDTLRFRVDLPFSGRLRIVGIEADGTAYTAWPPPGATLSDRYEQGRDIDLPEAVALDGVPGDERLHLVLCPESVEPRCTSAGALEPPVCPEGCRTTPFVVRKTRP